MYLTNIGARALEGRSFDLALTQANLITGDNGAGKTAIANAVTLLLLGYLPRLGNTNQATFELSSGPVLEVWGTFNTGATMRRRWSAKGDSVKKELLESVQELAQYGESLAVMLDAPTYFGLTDRERVEYVAANCPGESTMTLHEVVQRIAKIAGDFDLASLIASQDDPILKQVDGLIVIATDKWKASKETVKRMEETVRGLTTLRSQDAEMRPLAAIEDDQARCQRAITELNERKNVFAGSYTAMVSGRHRRAAIGRELNAGEKDRLEKIRLDEKLALVLMEIQKTGEPPDQNKINKSVVDAHHAQNQSAHHEIQASKQRLENETALAGLDHQTQCPYCGAHGDDWKAIKAAELATAIDDWKEKERQACEDGAKAKQAYDIAFTAYGLAAQTSERNKQLANEERTVRAELARIEPRLGRAKALEEERDRLPVDDPALETQAQMVQSDLNVRAEEGRRLAQEAKLAAGRAHDLKRLADAEKERDEAKKEQDMASAAGKELRLIQAELVEAVFKPLLETANAIFDGVPVYPRLAYRDGVIGTWRGGAWVGHRTFSGAERSLAYAAIQAALTSKAPLRIMVIDELGNFRRKNAQETAGALMLALDAGLIEQVIGIEPERPELYLPGEKQAWNIITVE